MKKQTDNIFLLPRAALNLSSGIFDGDGHKKENNQSIRKFYQACFDKSLLEKGLKDYCEKSHLQLATLNSTSLEPSEFAYTVTDKTKNMACPNIIIFVSKHATALALQLLPKKWLEDSKLFSVGRASQFFFDAESGNDNKLIVQCASKESGKGLMGLEAMQNLTGKSVLICKGNKGLNDIENVCLDRGANVEVFDLYERVASQQALNIDVNAIQSLYGVSSFVLQHFLDVLSESEKQQILAKPLYVMSNRIAEIAQQLQFSDIRTDTISGL